ncbi:MAG: response regulator [Cyanobacteria bacterium RM1_2_2]|nr:response regulator [Cyanobacteria bacterium RM1_2_2]
MQGKLSEIDIRSILQLIELGQRTGELFVESYGSPGFSPNREPGMGNSALWTRSPKVPKQAWLVFFLNGKIIYAGDGSSNLARLRDYLRRYKVEQTLSPNASAIATINAPEYGYLWALLENHVLTPDQGRSIIQSMVQETLFDLLSLHQGAFVFELGSALTPQLMVLDIAPLLKQIMKQVQEWKQFHPHIHSPEQCPVVADSVQLRKTLTESSFEVLERWADGKTSLRQMSRYVNRDIVTVARAVYPYVRQGLVQMLSPSEDAHSEEMIGSKGKVPRIVCIDDGVSVRVAVEQILNQNGYEATSISNPLKALSLVFQLKPDLILCDIAMPELDGYEICAMLRKSTAFRETPIIMLTGKDGFIDRVKARMVGATDYLTKPFGEGELLMLVEKYVGMGHPNRPEPDQLLAKAMQDDLEPNAEDSTPISPVS